MKFDALCDFVEDELVEIKRRLILVRSLDRERPRQQRTWLRDIVAERRWVCECRFVVDVLCCFGR